MLLAIKNGIRFAYGQAPIPSSIETWASLHKDKMSPDQLIASYIVESFMKDFDKWELVTERNTVNARSDDIWAKDTSRKPEVRWNIVNGFTLKGPKLTLVEALFRAAKDDDQTAPWIYCQKSASINGVAFDSQIAAMIIREYKKFAVKMRELNETAERVKNEMKASEDKWNLAEELIGMKRTKSGRLIAASAYCSRCDADAPEQGVLVKHNTSCPKYRKPVTTPRRPKLVEPFPEENLSCRA